MLLPVYLRLYNYPLTDYRLKKYVITFQQRLLLYNIMRLFYIQVWLSTQNKLPIGY